MCSCLESHPPGEGCFCTVVFRWRAVKPKTLNFARDPVSGVPIGERIRQRNPAGPGRHLHAVDIPLSRLLRQLIDLALRA
jgi:hypothetical protein